MPKCQIAITGTREELVKLLTDALGDISDDEINDTELTMGQVEITFSVEENE